VSVPFSLGNRKLPTAMARQLGKKEQPDSVRHSPHSFDDATLKSFNQHRAIESPWGPPSKSREGGLRREQQKLLTLHDAYSHVL
jgi:hypothetical protein